MHIVRIRVTLQPTVSQSVHVGVEPLWDSWPEFGCSQDSCNFVYRGASSLTGGRVCLVTGHSLCGSSSHMFFDIATGYELDDRIIGVRFPSGVGNFSLRNRVQTGSGAHRTSFPMGTGGFFPRGKAAGSIHLVSKSKNVWSCTSTPPYVFMAWCLVKHRDFTLLYFTQIRPRSGLCIFTTTSSRVLSITQPPIQWVPGALSLGVKRPGREADWSPPCSAEVKECVELYLHSPNTPPWRGV
jgi:hypothetical protein